MRSKAHPGGCQAPVCNRTPEVCCHGARWRIDKCSLSLNASKNRNHAKGKYKKKIEFHHLIYLFLLLKWLTERKYNFRIDLSLVWNLSITPMPFCEISHGAWPCGLKTLNNSSHKVGSTCNMFSFNRFSWWKKGIHKNNMKICIYIYMQNTSVFTSMCETSAQLVNLKSFCCSHLSLHLLGVWNEIPKSRRP